jgi:protein-tyrosine sulfotransferase
MKLMRDYLTKKNLIKFTSQNGLSADKLLKAARAFIYTTLLEHEKRKGSRLCLKDPHILADMSILADIFPASRFVWMVRDPRAQVTSMLLNLHSPLNDTALKSRLLAEWNEFNERVLQQCSSLAVEKRCMMIHYERLVLNLNETMRQVAAFLNVTWTEDFLHHKDFVGSRIVYRKQGWSAKQIKRAVNRDALIKWRRHVTFEKSRVDEHASVYKKLGYDMSEENGYEYLDKVNLVFSLKHDM